MEDNIAFLFHSKELPKDDIKDKDSRTAQVPKNEDVERIETKRYLSTAEHNLQKTKRSFAEKIDKLKKRAVSVQKDQERLRKNLIKYNNFVKEKRLKVEEGDRIYEEEKSFQETIVELIKERDTQFQFLTKAKNILIDSVDMRMVFKEYLQTVVGQEREERNRYKDIGELMKRCETLVVTRDEARKSLKSLQEEINRQEKSLAAFKESQNERILHLSSKQNILQDGLYQIQGKKDSKQRLIDQEEQIQNEKKLLIANIRLSILTLWQYVITKKVTLPGDTSKPATSTAMPNDNLEQQLETVMAHVEDLEAVILRVQRSEKVDGYMSPLLSFSELRIDF